MTVRRSDRAVMMAGLLVLGGCTQVYVPKPPPGGYPQVEPIELRAGLVLNDALRELPASQLDASSWVFHVGEALATSAEAVCRETFSELVVADSAPAGVDAVIVPRVVWIRATRPQYVWEASLLTITLEWRVEDPTGDLIWLETVRSTAAEPLGGLFGQVRQTRKRLDAVFRDLFLASHAALSGSPEIRDYAERLQGG